MFRLTGCWKRANDSRIGHRTSFPAIYYLFCFSCEKKKQKQKQKQKQNTHTKERVKSAELSIPFVP